MLLSQHEANMCTLQFLIMTLITALNGHLFAEENFLVYDVTAKEMLCERGPHCD